MTERSTSKVHVHNAPDEGNNGNGEYDVEAAASPSKSASPVSRAAVAASPEPHAATPAAASDAAAEVFDEGYKLPPVQLAYKNVSFNVEVKGNKRGEKETRNILNGCSGVFQPGRLTAIMGASGAGKTSLMNIVSGNPTEGNISGSIMVNGQDVFKSMERIREMSAYIQQDDILLATATVRESTALSARLRLPKSMSDESKMQRVQNTLDMLGLNKCAETIIGDEMNKGVSGGEKRRVSMALELIKSPAILFLDEPTSGLDTYTAHNIVSLLRDLAHEQGKTVVCTIHQPSSEIFRMFDDLVLVAHGSILYHGPASHTVQYFDRLGYTCPEHYNPSDFLFFKVLYSMEAQLRASLGEEMAGEALGGKGLIMNGDTGNGVDQAQKEQKIVVASSPNSNDTASLAEREASAARIYDAMQKAEKVRVDGLLESWRQSAECAAVESEVNSPMQSALPDVRLLRAERPGGWYAFQLLAQRRWNDLIRDKMKTRMQFGQYLFFSIMLGLIFLQQDHDQESVQNRMGLLFFVSVQALFMSFFSNLNTFGPEKMVMMREIESGMYRVHSFFFSRWIVEIPFRIVFPFIYSTILYWMVGFQPDAGRFFLFFVALMLIDNCGTNLAVCICSVFPDVQVAMQAGPAFILPLMVFSGFYVSLDSLGWWFRWFSYISPVKYGYVALLRNEMEGQTFSCPPAPQECFAPTGEDAIANQGLTDQPDIGLDLFILLALLGGYLLFAFLFMWKTSKRK